MERLLKLEHVMALEVAEIEKLMAAAKDEGGAA